MQESILDWFDRSWNGQINPPDEELAERLQARLDILEYARANYPKFRQQQKKRVKGQGYLFE